MKAKVIYGLISAGALVVWALGMILQTFGRPTTLWHAIWIPLFLGFGVGALMGKKKNEEHR